MVWSRIKKIETISSDTEKKFIRLYSVALLLYNGVLLNWTADHEFSLIPLSILLAYLAARLVMNLDGSLRKRLLVLFCVVALVQYFYINRPGTISREGTPYNAFSVLGEGLKKIPADYKIFMNIEPNPMVEYYAGRNITLFADSVQAKKFMHQWGITRAVWVAQDNYHLQTITTIH